MKLFHVGSGWKVGDTIEPGSWGKQSRHLGKGAGFHSYGDLNNCVIVGWEVALEVARQLTAPNAPSRLSCVFCTQDLESAKVFRDRFRKGQSIYEVEVDDAINTHPASYDSFTDPPEGAYVDANVSAAKAYWTDVPMGIKEILVGGAVTVSNKID